MRPGVTSTSVLGVKRVFGISVVRGPCHVNHFKIVPGVGTYAHKREGQKKFKTRGPSFTHSEINNQSLICPILPSFLSHETGVGWTIRRLTWHSFFEYVPLNPFPCSLLDKLLLRGNANAGLCSLLQMEWKFNPRDQSFSRAWRRILGNTLFTFICCARSDDSLHSLFHTYPK
jgi:hypothetical protein